jgi:hypothetical protein
MLVPVPVVDKIQRFLGAGNNVQVIGSRPAFESLPDKESFSLIVFN